MNCQKTFGCCCCSCGQLLRSAEAAAAAAAATRASAAGAKTWRLCVALIQLNDCADRFLPPHEKRKILCGASSAALCRFVAQSHPIATVAASAALAAPNWPAKRSFLPETRTISVKRTRRAAYASLPKFAGQPDDPAKNRVELHD